MCMSHQLQITARSLTRMEMEGYLMIEYAGATIGVSIVLPFAHAAHIGVLSMILNEIPKIAV